MLSVENGLTINKRLQRKADCGHKRYNILHSFQNAKVFVKGSRARAPVPYAVKYQGTNTLSCVNCHLQQQQKKGTI